jgi:hypothetical protein
MDQIQKSQKCKTHPSGTTGRLKKRFQIRFEPRSGVRLTYLADVWGLDAGALSLAESYVEGELDSKAGHGASGQGLDLSHSLYQTCLGFMGLQRQLERDKS